MTTSKKVLFIDGDKEARGHRTQELISCSSDYEVLEAETGRSGLELCESQRIDCVVLDEDLPDMLGFRVLLKLVARSPQIAVVVLTEPGLPITSQLLKNYGAQECLGRDRASGDELDKAVQKAIGLVASADEARRAS